MWWRSLRFKLVLVYTLLIVFAVELIGAYFVRALTTSLIHNQSNAAKSQAQLMATLVAPQIANDSKHINTSITSVLQSVPQFLSGTVYLLNSDGYVIYTSAGGALVGQKRTDTVATEALIHHTDAIAVRSDSMTNQHLLAVAVPILERKTFYGVIEYVLPIQSTYDTIRQVTTIFYTGSGIVLVLTIILGVILSRALTRPILDVTRQARVMAGGDFSRRVEAKSNDEFGDLVQAINFLADELDDALATNRLEQERLRAIITSMHDGVMALDSNGRILFMNRSAENILPEEAVAPEDGQELVHFLGLDELLQKSRVEGDQEELKSVRDVIYHITLTNIQRRDQTDGFVAVIRDVTEQEKLHQARRDFVSNVSHELRTPLTSVKSYIEVLRDLGDEERETRQQFLGVIDQETDRMVRLTRDLLQLSGLDRGNAYLTQTPIDVRDLLNQVYHRFYLPAISQDLTFEVDLSIGADVCVKANRDMMNRILDNIISNAMKYTPAYGRVSVSGNVSLKTVVIHIEDNGIGIPKEDLPFVFDRFYRVDKGRSRKLGGTGLGLALAREMTERMGGRIEIESEPDAGTQVSLIFNRHWEVTQE